MKLIFVGIRLAGSSQPLPGGHTLRQLYIYSSNHLTQSLEGTSLIQCMQGINIGTHSCRPTYPQGGQAYPNPGKGIIGHTSG